MIFPSTHSSSYPFFFLSHAYIGIFFLSEFFSLWISFFLNFWFSFFLWEFLSFLENIFLSLFLSFFVSFFLSSYAFVSIISPLSASITFFSYSKGKANIFTHTHPYLWLQTLMFLFVIFFVMETLMSKSHLGIYTTFLSVQTCTLYTYKYIFLFINVNDFFWVALKNTLSNRLTFIIFY